MCKMAAPAVIPWVSPLVMRPPPPFESWWSKIPSMMYGKRSVHREALAFTPAGAVVTDVTRRSWVVAGSGRGTLDAGGRREPATIPRSPEGRPACDERV